MTEPQVLIADRYRLYWIAAVDGAGELFFVGAWLVILMGYLGIVALVGFYDTLRLAGPAMILAPILGAVGLTLVTVSHLIPIAMGLPTSAGLHRRRPGRTGHTGGHRRHLRRHGPGDQRRR